MQIDANAAAEVAKIGALADLEVTKIQADAAVKSPSAVKYASRVKFASANPRKFASSFSGNPGASEIRFLRTE